MTWPMVKLRKLVLANYGKALKKENRNEGGAINVFGSAGDVGFHNEALIPGQTIVVGRKGSVGKITWAPKGGWIIDTAYYLTIKDKVELDWRYLFYVLKDSKLDRKTITTSIPGLNREDFYDTEIPLPPLDEQKRIAAILDKADAIRQKRKQATQLADDFLRSVFLDMFGDPVSNPKSWAVKPLKNDIYHANNGLSRRRKEEVNSGEIVLRLQDVHYEGIRFEKELNRISLDEKEKEKFRLDAGDILFIRVNGNPDYVGRSAVFQGHNEAIYHNDHLIRIKLTESFEPNFLCYVFNSLGGRKLISKYVKTSAGQHTISQAGIEVIEIYRPPIALQHSFLVLMNLIKKSSAKSQGISELEDNLFEVLSQRAFSCEL
ncbi:restriction endonuclease subunit S [Shewanella sp. 125m-7]